MSHFQHETPMPEVPMHDPTPAPPEPSPGEPSPQGAPEHDPPVYPERDVKAMRVIYDESGVPG